MDHGDDEADWAIQLAQSIGRRVAATRGKKTMTAQQLADRCAVLGLPSLSRIVIAKLENGRRESVSVAEILVLAAALDVTPAELVFPFGQSAYAQVLPGHEAPIAHASLWLGGQARLGDTDLTPSSTFVLPTPSAHWYETSPRLYTAYDSLTASLRERRLRGPMAHESEQDFAAHLDVMVQLQYRMRAEMERRGLPVPAAGPDEAGDR